MGLCCPGPSPVLGGTRSRVCALSFSPSKCICQLLSLYLCKYKHIFLRPHFHTCLEISISLKIVLWENCTRLKNRLQKKTSLMSWNIEIVISPSTNHLSKALTVEVRKPNCTKNVREQIWNAKTPNRLTTLAGKKSKGIKIAPL